MMRDMKLKQLAATTQGQCVPPCRGLAAFPMKWPDELGEAEIKGFSDSRGGALATGRRPAGEDLVDLRQGDPAI